MSEKGRQLAETSEGTDNRPTILFVLAMARSGTSALTRVLSLCGAALPAGMLGANKGNQRGYWEPRESIYLNLRILRERGSGWWDLAIPNGDEIDTAKHDASTADVKAYLATLPAAPLVVIKDVQIVPSAELWFDAAVQSGFRVATVIAVRNPDEVTASMEDHIKANPAFASALWLKSNLLSERNSRSVPRVFVEYRNLMDDWRGEVERISAALSIGLSTANGGAIDEFLTSALRHKKHSGPVADRFGANWISKTYEILSAAAQDEPVDTVALDRILDAYQGSQRDFQLAFDWTRNYNASARLFLRPSITKLIFELRATAHRRKGTWA